MTGRRDEARLLPCPFCGDPMTWIEAAAVFSHSPAASEVAPENARCFMRHAYFHPEQVVAWNTRALSTPPATDEAMSHDEADLLGIVSRMHTAWMQRDELMRQQGGIELIEKMAGLLDQIADDVPVLWKATAKALSHPVAELSRMSDAPKSATDEDVKLCERLREIAGYIDVSLAETNRRVLREAAARISQIPTLIEEERARAIEEAARTVRMLRSPCFGKMSASDRNRNSALLDAEEAILNALVSKSEPPMSEWKPTKAENPDFRCRKCGSNEIRYQLHESSCGGFEDYHYRCECGNDWWAESADA